MSGDLRSIAQAAAAVTSLAAAIGGEPWRLDGWPQEVVDFLAEFDPPTVLALLDERDALAVKVARVETLAGEDVARRAQHVGADDCGCAYKDCYECGKWHNCTHTPWVAIRAALKDQP